MQNVLITGGSGLIGSALTELLLSKDYNVTILSRNKRKATNKVQFAHWDPSRGTIDIDAVQKADFIVHLAGEGVADKRWTKQRKQQILESRTQSGELLKSILNTNPNNVQAFISSSAIGWYGPDAKQGNQKPFTEDDPASDDFLGSTCKLWEESVTGIENENRRLVIVRTGIVLSTDGGALREFLKPVRFGLAAILGSGDQVISWIHITDLCRIYLMAIEDVRMKGIFNAVAPAPVSNSELTQKLAEKVKGKFYLPAHVPSFALKLALGEMSVEVLKSATVSSAKIQKEGFQFLYPGIDSALSNLVKPNT